MEILRGDIIYADFSPGIKSEQLGLRPCLVIQNDKGNKFSPTVTVVPITSVISKKRMPTHVKINAGQFGINRDSLILCEAVRTLDKLRFREKIGRVDNVILSKVEMGIMLNLGIL